MYKKPNNVQTLHFPVKNSEDSMHKTENHEPLFAEMPQIHVLSNLKQFFSYRESSKFSEEFWRFELSIE